MTVARRLLRNSAVAAVASTPWNVRLRELAYQSFFSESISLYRSMLRSGSSPDAFSFPFTLKSCAALALSISGQQLHCHVIRGGCEAEPFVLTALISMYCKCGLIEDARKVFDENPQSGHLGVCYNALISGYTANSKVSDAVFMFRRMKETGVSMDSVTMLGLVPLCTVPDYLWLGMSLHGQCVKGGIYSEVAVLNSFITMYMKCGSVGLGRRLFDEMPVKGLITWNAVISGYSQNGLAYDVLELYEKMKSMSVCPDPVTLVSVLSSCAHLGAQKIGREVEKLVEANGFVSNVFVCNALIAGDRSHAQTEEVHKMLDELETSVMEITENTDCDRGEEDLSSRREHSERLAVAFGILNNSPGTEILVIKNLRVCEDCHVFIKLVSKIVDRRFVVRDASQFHCFKDGFCSWKDYW